MITLTLFITESKRSVEDGNAKENSDRLKDFNRVKNRKGVKLLTLDDFDLKGKTVFLRVDMNCPIDPNTMEISGTRRIEEASETISAIKDAKLVVATHQGRVGNKDYTGMGQHADVLENFEEKNKVCRGCDWLGCTK